MAKFFTYKYAKNIELPGIKINFLKGIGPLEKDNLFSGQQLVSQRERAFLESFQVSRKLRSAYKTLSFPELEEKLEQIIRTNGEEELNKVRDRAP